MDGNFAVEDKWVGEDNIKIDKNYQAKGKIIQIEKE